MLKKLCSFCALLLMLMVGTSAQNTAKEAANRFVLNKIQGQKPRNVVFILSDDHRYDFMGFTGKLPWLKTPNLDRLFKEGAWSSSSSLVGMG